MMMMMKYVLCFVMCSLLIGRGGVSVVNRSYLVFTSSSSSSSSRGWKGEMAKKRREENEEVVVYGEERRGK